MGTAFAGENATTIFQENTGTTGSFHGYMLVGALLFGLVSNTLWNFSFWLRREQTTGTLESGVYLVPTSKFWLILGSSLYVLVRNSVSFILALLIGLVIFSIPLSDYLSETIFLAIFALILGMPPLIGLALLLGAFVLKFKEVGAFVDMVLWIISFLMGIFFPVILFPPAIKFIALLFPPTWTANEIRGFLYNADQFVGFWEDFLISFGFALVIPLIAFYLFYRTEKGILGNQGVGQY
jgi:ABC-2 type transport system permease protein